jgi:fructosamine-3-kinase
MVFDKTQIDTETATKLVRRVLGKDLAVTRLTRMHGGMVNSVLELTTDGRPARIVAKLNGRVGHGGFEHERDVLDWISHHTDFPVPEPYGVDTSGELFEGSALLLQRLPGVNLGEARLAGADGADVERQMARHVAALHEHNRETYGSALQPASDGHRRWVDVFRPRMRKEYEQAAPKLSETARREAREVIDNLEAWLPESGRPTLVHGDLWATNIIVNPDGIEGPHVTGYVDGGAEYTDREYELAYLLVFNTAGQAFFREYQKYHELRDGFELRCRVYWLNTMLLHVRAFGDEHYVRNSESLAHQLASARPPGM